MIKAEVKNMEGKKVGEVELDPKIFGVGLNENLIHQVYTSQYANKRQLIAHAKDRSERKGSGAKPWRQKGTGRARTGSIRNPIWRKGGVTFGPSKERNFKKKINLKMKKRATAMALSAKLKAKKLLIIEKFDYKDNKTREAKKILDNNKLTGSVLWAYNLKDKDKERASRNLDKSRNVKVENLSVFNILNNQYLIIDQVGVKKLEERLS